MSRFVPTHEVVSQRKRIALTIVLAGLQIAASCGIHHAAPPPFVTFGTTVAPKGGLLLGGGFGGGNEDFPNDKGWSDGGLYGSIRYGVHDSIDVGIDLQGIGGYNIIMSKMALRLRVPQSGRIDIGIGRGKIREEYGPKHTAFGGDLGLVLDIGSRAWSMKPYAGIKFVGARGSSSQSQVLSDDGTPHVLYLSAIAGISNPDERGNGFILEGGIGRVFVEGQDSGVAVYMGVGFQGRWDLTMDQEAK